MERPIKAPGIPAPASDDLALSSCRPCLVIAHFLFLQIILIEMIARGIYDDFAALSQDFTLSDGNL